MGVMCINSFNEKIKINGEKISFIDFRKFRQIDGGDGLQLANDIEHKRGEILDLCDTISKATYELWDILDDA